MKRLFAAVDLDDHTREEIDRISITARDRLLSDGKRFRVTWVRADRLHLTLVFFGEVDRAAEDQARSSLQEPFLTPAFKLCFGGLGVFPARGSPRVLWLGITEGLTELRSVHAELRRRIPGLGKPEDEFSPHLTLARLRDGVPRSALAPITRLPAQAGPCLIDRVTLYESRLSPDGPSYFGLDHAELQPCT